MAGKDHSEAAPFALLLVELTDGSRVLGRFVSPDVPPIGSHVSFTASANETPVFEQILEES
jgi:uncharacterized OB-fold protein